MADTTAFDAPKAKAKGFARKHPWATATLLAVLGIATINTLRGK